MSRRKRLEMPSQNEHAAWNYVVKRTSELDMTLHEFAQCTGYNVENLKRHMTAPCLTTVDDIMRVARGLDVSPYEIFARCAIAYEARKNNGK